MIKKVFAVYDSKAEYYKNPFMLTTVGEALRMFGDIVNDGRSEINLHPEDYTLMQIAEYDEIKGEYKNIPANISLGTGIEFKKEDMQRQLNLGEGE